VLQHPTDRPMECLPLAQSGRSGMSADRSAIGVKRTIFARCEPFRSCDGFRTPAHHNSGTHAGPGAGRCTKTAKERNRGRRREVYLGSRVLWGFEGGSAADNDAERRTRIEPHGRRWGGGRVGRRGLIAVGAIE
jgi:hypothetical protein